LAVAAQRAAVHAWLVQHFRRIERDAPDAAEAIAAGIYLCGLVIAVLLIAGSRA
jgi:hypothetical protein